MPENKEHAGRTRAVVTGGGGEILGEVALQLGRSGISVAVWDLSLEKAQRTADAIEADGGEAQAVQCDVTSRESIAKAVESALSHWGRIDILINGAGGSHPSTTTSADLTFFEIDPTDIKMVMDLNYLSIVLCCQAVGKIMAEQESGSIVNVTSVAGISPLTRAVAYSNGKSAANSFTQWLAVHMSHNYSTKIRVNAVAPGFVLTEQNRFLLVEPETGELTDRGKQILRAVPAARYGTAREIAEVVVFLSGDGAAFVNGAVIPVDGGFTAYSGV